ncbi:MAG: TerB N-terminal domain-containing protein [Clostridiales bacterium]|nr:TerB N-terminal domain-containing protein [Clostridiales bacterium]
MNDAYTQIKKSREVIDGSFGEKVYGSQPLKRPGQPAAGKPPRQPSPRGDVPAQIRRLLSMIRDEKRETAMGPWSGRLSEEEYFCRQAKFIADYEDSGPYAYDSRMQNIFWPTYSRLGYDELVNYFRWRTAVRHGEFPKAPLPFQYLHIYEILNQAGTASFMDGYEQLCAMQEHYGKEKSGVGLNLSQWIFDYAVYYQLPHEIVEQTDLVRMDRALSIVLDSGAHGADEVVDAAVMLSTYRADRSSFIKKYPTIFRDVTFRVLKRLEEYYDKNRKVGFWEGMFGVQCTRRYRMFDGAVFYERREDYDALFMTYIYDADPLRVFICADGDWTCDGYYQPDRNPDLGKILRATDSMLREQYSYPDPLKSTLSTRYVCAIIKKEVQAYYKERRREEEIRRQQEESRPREITLDLGKLDGIRRAADMTQQRLMEGVEDGFEEPGQPGQEVKSGFNFDDASPEETLGFGEGNVFPEEQQVLLSALLCGGNYQDYFTKNHLLLSVVAEAINERFYDEIGDSVIGFDGDAPVLVEDYREDVKALLDGQ